MNYFVEWWSACIPPAIAVLLLVPGFVLIGLVVALIALAVVAVALAGAIVATPYLLGRFLLGHWRARSASGHRPALPGTLSGDAKRI